MERGIKQEYGEAHTASGMQESPTFVPQVSMSALHHASGFKSNQAAMGLPEQYYLQPADQAEVVTMNGVPCPSGEMPDMPADMDPSGDVDKQPMFVRYSIEQGERELNSKCLPKKYKCGMCIYKTSYKSDLNRHLKKHNMDHSYRCHLCNMPFKTPGNVYNHMRNMHFNEMQFLQCQQCSYVAMDESSIRKHIVNCHGGSVDTTAGTVSVLSNETPPGSQFSPEDHSLSPLVQFGMGGGETRHTYFGFPPSHGVSESTPGSEALAATRKNSTEKLLSKSEVVIDLDDGGVERLKRKIETLSREQSRNEVDLVSDDDPPDDSVASSSRTGPEGDGRAEGRMPRKASPGSGSPGEKEEFQRPSSTQEKPSASRSSASMRSTPEVQPSPSRSSSTPGSTSEYPQLTSPPADWARHGAKVDTSTGQIEHQMADTTGRILSSPGNQRPTTTSPSSSQTGQSVSYGLGGSGRQRGPGHSTSSHGAVPVGTAMSTMVSRPLSYPHSGDMSRRRFSSFRAARQSVSRAAGSLRGRSFAAPRRQQCEGCREFFHTPQFLARHRAQCPAFLALKSKSAMSALPYRVLPLSSTRPQMLAVSSAMSSISPSGAVQGVVSPELSQRAEDGAVTSTPPSSGRYAKLVSDFDSFAASPFACALCFFRTASAAELVQHVDNHLTGCNANPVPETARFSVSWSTR